MNNLHTSQATLETSNQATNAEYTHKISYMIGVDGGGTGTRVVLADESGTELARGAGGPSGLVHGRQKAWDSILVAIRQAFQDVNLAMPELSAMAIGCGLAGVNNVQWAAEFIALNPGFAVLKAETDAYTTLLGAHLGQPGVVIALGTGSVGEVLQADGQRREVGGWGFPVSDEASGAWLGLHAVNHLQRTLDGRALANPFSAAVLAHCGGNKDAVFAWLASANQTRYAELAPIVIRCAAEVDVARNIMLAAGREVQAMAHALDASGQLPIALCGGLAAVMTHYLPLELQQRVQKPQGDSASGALILIQHYLQKYNKRDKKMLTQLDDFKPDNESSTPLYLQLANKLANGIHSGQWQPDEALPSERMLSEVLQISRVTARKAIDMLCERGLLTRKHGSGTYITPKLEQPLSRLTNFSEELRQRGFVPGSRWISRETGIASPEEILSLGLSPNTVVSRLKRLRTADNVVMAIESTTVPAMYMPNPKLVTDSLYGYLESHNVAPTRALQHIRAVNATPEQARLADIKQGAAMLFITRVGYLPNGTAIELSHSYCRSDYYDFVAELFR